jgi:hypothetical protein
MRRACQLGFTPASGGIGNLISNFNFRSGIHNMEELYALLCKGCESGDPIAMHYRGFLVQTEKSYSQELVSAQEWFWRAHEHGCGFSGFFLESKVSEYDWMRLYALRYKQAQNLGVVLISETPKKASRFQDAIFAFSAKLATFFTTCDTEEKRYLMGELMFDFGLGSSYFHEMKPADQELGKELCQFYDLKIQVFIKSCYYVIWMLKGYGVPKDVQKLIVARLFEHLGKCDDE